MATKQPNIIVIYPDQMRADAMSCAGNPCIRTPNLDRLASQGVRFSNAFTSFPLCSPFRASFMTGKYAHSAGMCANHYPIPLNQDFLADILRRNGYRTGYFGKWHLNGGPKHGPVRREERLGFETFRGFSRGHRYFNSIYYKDDDPQPYTSRCYEPDYQTDHIIEFMEKPSDLPFFAMICYGIPHPPLDAPPEYLNMYSTRDVPIEENTPQDEEFRAKARDFLAKYYGLVACVDANVGKILDWLDRKNLSENTLVIFVSDHGEMAGEHGLYDKKTYYRSSMQVPLIVRYPACFKGGRVLSNLVDPSVDTMPTILDMCGITVPKDVQGKSYLSLLDGSDKPTRDAIHYEICMEKEGPEKFPIPERGIRTLDWLYVRTEEKPIALFNLRDDPLEMNNLVHSTAHKKIMENLDARITEHMKQTNDRWDIQAVFPPPNFQSHEDGAKLAEDLSKMAIVE